MWIYAIFATSVIAGFCMMALEIIGGRYLYPDFGTSVDVWAAIITVFILSISVGSWLGGRIADRYHSNRPLGWILLIAGIFYLLLPTYARDFSHALGPAVHQARPGSLLAAIVLFLPPSLLLGCVTPMLVKLLHATGTRVGHATGTLLFVSNIGSVLGILVADYVLLTYFTLNANVLVMGMVLGLLGVIHILRTVVTVGADAVEAAAADSVAEAS
ncbi:MAG: fused MFS/spermidine synthase [Planctomycetota bacterium]